MKQAIAYAAEEFRSIGIAISPAKLEAAIEAAWLDYQAKAGHPPSDNSQDRSAQAGLSASQTVQGAAPQ